MVYQKGSIELGREKVIFLTEKFLEAINNHEGIRPYLREYPFPISRVSTGLAFCQPNNHPYVDGSVTDADYARGNIFYWGQDLNEKDKTILFLKEAYPDASNPINQAISDKQPVPAVQKEIAVVVPSRKRLGTLAIDLSGFTPGRELEALGISGKAEDIAEEIGELIGGVCDLYFDEAFLERLAQTVSQNSEGEFLEYWDNGQAKAKIPYKNGHGEGHIHAWYPDGGSAFKSYYQEGKRVGIQFAFYPREIMKGSDPFGRIFEYDTKGKLTNKQQTCSPSDNLLSSICYNHGILNGTVTFYNNKKTDRVLGRWEYKKGKVVKVTVAPRATVGAD
jgi:hypothetical protein